MLSYLTHRSLDGRVSPVIQVYAMYSSFVPSTRNLRTVMMAPFSVPTTATPRLSMSTGYHQNPHLIIPYCTAGETEASLLKRLPPY